MFCNESAKELTDGLKVLNHSGTTDRTVHSLTEETDEVSLISFSILFNFSAEEKETLRDGIFMRDI